MIYQVFVQGCKSFVDAKDAEDAIGKVVESLIALGYENDLGMDEDRIIEMAQEGRVPVEYVHELLVEVCGINFHEEDLGAVPIV